MDEQSFSELVKIHYSQPLSYFLQIDKKSVPLANVKLLKSSSPVRKPTKRGGVYFSDVTIFKIIGTIDDFSLVGILSNTMLGPNPEFKELIIKIEFPKEKNLENFLLKTNLTNSMQNSSKIELNMRIIEIENSFMN